MPRKRAQEGVRNTAVMTSLTAEEAQALKQVAFDLSAERGERVTVSDLIRDLILANLLAAPSRPRRPVSRR